MRRIALTVLLSGLFLLMLSALVVTPEDAALPPPLSDPANLHAVFMPPAELPAPVSPDAAPEKHQEGCAQGGICSLPAMAVHVPDCRDSNGRVLSACRYENSVYQVFRPEVAGG